MKRNHVVIVLAATAMAFTVGCSKMSSGGANLNSASVGSSTGSSTSATNLVNQTKADIAAYDQQNADLLNQVNSLNNQLGSITLSSLQSGGTTTTGGAVIAAQMPAGSPMRARSIQSAISNMLNGVYNGVAKLYAKIDDVEAKIESRIAQLNLNDPAQLATATALQASLVYLQQGKVKLDALKAQLVVKVQGLTNSIDTKLAGLNQNSPLTWVAEIYWAQLKVLFVNFENELNALK